MLMDMCFGKSNKTTELVVAGSISLIYIVSVAFGEFTDQRKAVPWRHRGKFLKQSLFAVTGPYNQRNQNARMIPQNSVATSVGPESLPLSSPRNHRQLQ